MLISIHTINDLLCCVVISSVLEKKHSRLGSDVQITVYDDNLASFESDDLSDRSPSPPPPRIILVSNITESGFQNETALTKYFGNAKRSGGGEIETTEYHGNGRATITFKNHSGKLIKFAFFL